MTSRFLFFLMLFIGVIGCANSVEVMEHPHATPTPFPAPLACDTPDGMLGIVIGDITDLHLRVGGGSAPLIHFGLCNRTDQPVGMRDILITEHRTDRPGTSDQDVVIPIIGFADRGGGAVVLILSSANITDDGVLTFMVDDRQPIMPGEFREYMLEGFSNDLDGETEFRIGTASGTFADLSSFSTSSSSLTEDMVYNNVAIIRQMIVTR